MDFGGGEPQVGDVVVYMGFSHATLALGRIDKVNPKSFYLHELTEEAKGLHYKPVSNLVPSRKVSLLSDQMRHLDDIEIWLHYARLRGLEQN